MTKPRTISSAQEFEALMAEVDLHFQETAAPFPGRELRAAQEVAKRLGQGFPMGGVVDTTPIPGVYTGASLAGHIYEWVERRYGDRLKVDFSHGYGALSLRNDAWLLRIPIVFGMAQFVVERDLSKKRPNRVVYRPGSPQVLAINVLTLLRELPQGLADVLSADELKNVLSDFIASYEAFLFLDGNKESGLVRSAIGDLTSSARRATGRVEEYGLSRWDSLQAAEKALKYGIELRKLSFPQTHKLHRLADIALPAALIKTASPLLDAVQCDAGVRYEARDHARSDVVRAHRAATEIIRLVAAGAAPNP